MLMLTTIKYNIKWVHCVSNFVHHPHKIVLDFWGICDHQGFRKTSGGFVVQANIHINAWNNDDNDYLPC